MVELFRRGVLGGSACGARRASGRCWRALTVASQLMQRLLFGSLTSSFSFFSCRRSIAFWLAMMTFSCCAEATALHGSAERAR